jgi:hypothetical protein
MDSALADVLEDLLRIIEAHDQNLDWTATWNTTEEMIAELRDHLSRLRLGDLSRLDRLRLLFLPTGALQEVSLSSGWAGAYLKLAARFDQGYGRGPDHGRRRAGGDVQGP